MKRLFVLSSLLFAMTMNLSCGSDALFAESNPLLEEWTTEFGVPPFDKIRTEHFEPAYEEAMKMHNEEIAAIVKNRSSELRDDALSVLASFGEVMIEYEGGKCRIV